MVQAARAVMWYLRQRQWHSGTDVLLKVAEAVRTPRLIGSTYDLELFVATRANCSNANAPEVKMKERKEGRKEGWKKTTTKGNK